MIESLDPNLNVLPPPQSEAQQTEPIKPESVKIEKQELERRKTDDGSQDGRKRRKRRKRVKDKVELSGLADVSDEEQQVNEEQSGENSGDEDQKNIDVFI